MGGCHSRTVKQVTDDLEAELRESAQDMLYKQFGKKLDSSASLEDYAQALSTAEFKQAFGYEWASDSTNCKPLDVDPHDPHVYPASDFCIIPDTQNLTDAIGNYVDQGLSSLHLDKWMKDKATSDLAALVGQFLSYPVDNAWHYKSINEQYDAADTSEDSYKLDVALLYTNATRTECATEVTLHIMYFVGVYYTVISPKATTFAALRTDAYTAASGLPNVTQSVKDDNGLLTALKQYEAPIFKTTYGYDYDSGKPSDATKDASEPIFARNNYLCFFPQRAGLTDEQLDAYIRLHIMTGFGLPPNDQIDWTTLITDDIRAQFRNVLNNPSSNTWNNVTLRQSYGLQKASVRPLKLNALVDAWYGSQTISINNQDVLVEMIYLYFQGIVYEMQEDPIIQDMKHVIVKNIPGVDQGMIPAKITSTQLNDYIRTWNLSNFQRVNGFSYPTTPSTDAHVNHWEGVFEFKTWNPSQSDIMTQIESQIFGPDDKADAKIHHGLQKPVYDYLVKWFTQYAGSNETKDDDEWYNRTRTNSFPYKPKTDTWDLDIATSFAFSNATMVEDGRGDPPIYYFYMDLLVYASTKKDNMSSGDV